MNAIGNKKTKAPNPQTDPEQPTSETKKIQKQNNLTDCYIVE